MCKHCSNVARRRGNGATRNPCFVNNIWTGRVNVLVRGVATAYPPPARAARELWGRRPPAGAERRGRAGAGGWGHPSLPLINPWRQSITSARSMCSPTISTSSAVHGQRDDDDQQRDGRTEREEPAAEMDRAAEREEEAHDKAVVLVKERARDGGPAPRGKAEEEAGEQPGDRCADRRGRIEGSVKGDPPGERERDVVAED